MIVLILVLVVGFSGRFGDYGYGFGHSGIGVLLIVIVVLFSWDLSNR